METLINNDEIAGLHAVGILSWDSQFIGNILIFLGLLLGTFLCFLFLRYLFFQKKKKEKIVSPQRNFGEILSLTIPPEEKLKRLEMAWGGKLPEAIYREFDAVIFLGKRDLNTDLICKYLGLSLE